jgi:hypothetical protein
MVIKISSRWYWIIVVIVAWCFYNHHILSSTHLPSLNLLSQQCHAMPFHLFMTLQNEKNRLLHINLHFISCCYVIMAKKVKKITIFKSPWLNHVWGSTPHWAINKNRHQKHQNFLWRSSWATTLPLLQGLVHVTFFLVQNENKCNCNIIKPNDFSCFKKSHL